MTTLKILHEPTGELLAEGPRGLLGITTFEGGWYYWLPNPLLFFTAFRVAIARDAACLSVEESA